MSDKCEVSHFGKSILGKTFTVNNRALGCGIEQSVVGVQVHSCVKVTSEMDRAMKTVWHEVKESRS